MFRPQALQAGLQFNYQESGTLPRYVHTDPKRLRQILINLLSNAIKFTKQGHVTLRVKHRREIAYIEVEDSGIGIAQENQERVFMPFERVAHPISKAEGTGIGLTITQVLVDLMGGSIRLESQPGEGTCFFVRLYLPVVSEVSLSVPDSVVTGYFGPRRHVLIVDDEADHRSLLRLLLKPLGFVIRESASGAEALRAVADQRPDLLLLDIGLPDLRGWDVSQRLRGTSTLPIPTIMVSANAHENLPGGEHDSLHDGFVAKPFSETVLLEQIQKVLGLRWVRKSPTGNAAPAQPEPSVARELLALVAANYLRAFRARLSELVEEDPALGTWAKRCLGFIESDRRKLTEMLMESIESHEHI